MKGVVPQRCKVADLNCACSAVVKSLPKRLRWLRRLCRRFQLSLHSGTNALGG